MNLQTASRTKAKIKMAIQAPAGAGKTYSALLIAYGICNDWESIAVIDTENRSANLYAHLGRYHILHLSAPFHPERYSEALQVCINAGMQVVIIDSISHEWEGTGGILDIHSAMPGNSFANWSKVTPRHNLFVQTLLQSDIHVIATIRTKQDYILTEKNGKQVPEKVGLKGITREGMDYEFTLVFDLNIKHQATASKDRTGLFADQPAFIPSAETGQKITGWCNKGIDPLDEQINACTTVEELIALYKASAAFHQSHGQLFSIRKKQLQSASTTPSIIQLKSPQHDYRYRN